ncbi:hypothetical protein [Pseudomonas viridiflava]|nr:hypothetical protein [Pseudomonas viridiflava]
MIDDEINQGIGKILVAIAPQKRKKYCRSRAVLGKRSLQTII